MDSSCGSDSLNRSNARSNQKLIGNINKYPTRDYEIKHVGHTNGIPPEVLEISCLKQVS